MLLVIASALGVFGEYLGNQHATKIRNCLSQLDDCGFIKSDGKTVPWAGPTDLKTVWDDLKSEAPIPAFGPVAALFGFLVFSLLCVSTYEGATLWGVARTTLEKSTHWLLLMEGGFLSVIALWLAQRLNKMRKKEGELRSSVGTFLGRHKTAEATWDAAKSDASSVDIQ